MSDEGGLTFVTLKNINLRVMGDPPPLDWSHRDYWYEGYARSTAGASTFTKVFRGFHDRSRGTWQAPHWLLTVLSAWTAALPWTALWGWRFSLRTLLFATTLVAVGLGIVVAAI